MQTAVFNVLVKNSRSQKNFSLPPELAPVVSEIANRYGDKRRWAVYVAALLWFVQLPQSAQDAMVRDVVGARSVPGALAGLFAERMGAPVVGAPPIPPKRRKPRPPSRPAPGPPPPPGRGGQDSGRGRPK